MDILQSEGFNAIVNMPVSLQSFKSYIVKSDANIRPLLMYLCIITSTSLRVH